MKVILTAFLGLAVLFCRSQESSSCNASCSCRNNLTPAGVMISQIHEKNEWMVSYRYMNMQMHDLISGTNSINKDVVFNKYLMSPDNMTMNMHMLMLMYGVSDRFTVMAMMNYNFGSMKMSMFSSEAHHHGGGSSMQGNEHEMKTSGISDLKLYVSYGLLKKEATQLSLNLGLSIPTGNIYLRGSEDDLMYPDRRLPYGMQLGSGSVDFLPVVNYLYQKNRFSYSLQAAGVIRPWYNKLNYALGNEVTANTWLAYKWCDYISSSLRSEFSSSEKVDGYDKNLYAYNEPSANPVNYGGKKVQIFLGSLFQMKKGCLKNNRFGVEYGIPVYQSVNGIQMKVKQILNASWALNF